MYIPCTGWGTDIRSEGRLRNAVVLCIIWIVLMIPSAFYIQMYTDLGLTDLFMVILPAISGFIQMIGAMVYIGSHEALAGFSTMSEKEREQFEEQYDAEKMMSFMGI